MKVSVSLALLFFGLEAIRNVSQNGKVLKIVCKGSKLMANFLEISMVNTHCYSSLWVLEGRDVLAIIWM